MYIMSTEKFGHVHKQHKKGHVHKEYKKGHIHKEHKKRTDVQRNQRGQLFTQIKERGQTCTQGDRYT